MWWSSRFHWVRPYHLEVLQMDLFGHTPTTQSELAFPVSLTERYRPLSPAEFVGLAKPKLICSKLAERPFDSGWLFIGPSGTGKTTMALALAALIPAEVHHVPSQQCTLAELERVASTCHRVPTYGKRFHLVLVDEADRMSDAAQLAPRHARQLYGYSPRMKLRAYRIAFCRE
jgi:replication-associated recombination protein RarA